MEVGEEAPRRQLEELVPGQVEFSELRQEQDKVPEVVVAQVQHLHTRRTRECVHEAGTLRTGLQVPPELPADSG